MGALSGKLRARAIARLYLTLACVPMFEDWKKAWQEAVANFERELGDDGEIEGPVQLAAMRRDFKAARGALSRLTSEVQTSRAELTEEENQEQVCRRRGALAAGIGDEETVKLASQWAERHAQRALILRQKVTALEAELTMRTEDLATMEAQLQQAQRQLGVGDEADPKRPPMPFAERTKQDAEFRRLDKEAREKAAEARLEELKKRMK
jgi:hypothetical protein